MVSSRFAESRFAESRFAESRFAESRFAESRFAESRFAESRFAESGFHYEVIINLNTTATMMSRSIQASPCCAVGRFICRRLRVSGKAGCPWRVSAACSHGPAGEAGK